jgi:hypothetical protein
MLLFRAHDSNPSTELDSCFFGPYANNLGVETLDSHVCIPALVACVHTSICTTKDDTSRLVEIPRKSQAGCFNLGQFLLGNVASLQSLLQLLIVFYADIVIAKIVVERPRDLTGVLDCVRCISIMCWVPRRTANISKIRPTQCREVVTYRKALARPSKSTTHFCSSKRSQGTV